MFLRWAALGLAVAKPFADYDCAWVPHALQVQKAVGESSEFEQISLENVDFQ